MQDHMASKPRRASGGLRIPEGRRQHQEADRTPRALTFNKTPVVHYFGFLLQLHACWIPFVCDSHLQVSLYIRVGSRMGLNVFA